MNLTISGTLTTEAGTFEGRIVAVLRNQQRVLMVTAKNGTRLYTEPITAVRKVTGERRTYEADLESGETVTFKSDKGCGCGG